ncbi:MAG TPA: acyltransferase [Candidatus Hydrogenedentes bacterium]|nr:acyltransferase [Candidatus Hydrogenedentota bacterium]
MNNTPTAPPSVQRMDYIDHLRIFLTALVICHHQAIGFGAPGGWYYIVAQPEDIFSMVTLTMFVAINQSFFMSLFFFVAAYFTPASLDKKGLSRFMRDRLIRLGIPLVVYFFLLNPTLAYIIRRFKDLVEPGYFRFMAASALDCVGWGPLWFVLSLLIFTSVYAGVVAWRQHIGRPLAALPRPNNRRILGFILAIGLVTFFVRLAYPVGTERIGLQVGYFPLYIAFFIFGIQAYRAGWLDHVEPAQTALWFRIAVALIIALPAILILGGALNGGGDAFSGGLTPQALVYALWEPFLCVGISMKLLALFRARWSLASAFSRLLAESAYAAYIIHPFVVVLATRLARDWPVPPMLTFLIIAPIAVASCFFIANMIRQAPLLNKVL